MKAQDMVQAVYRAEKELAAELSDAVNKKLTELREETGLDFGSVTFNTCETTCYGDGDRSWKVTHAEITYGLPNPVDIGG